MVSQRKVRVAVNGYGVIGKRVADAIALQHDMNLVGISDVATDWRMRIVTRKGFDFVWRDPRACPGHGAGWPAGGWNVG